MSSPSASLPLIPSGLLAMPPLAVAQIALVVAAQKRKRFGLSSSTR